MIDSLKEILRTIVGGAGREARDSLVEIANAMVEAGGYEALFEVGLAIEEAGAWEVMVSQTPLHFGGKQNYYVGRIKTFWEAFGEEGTIRARDFDTPQIHIPPMTPGHGRMSLQEPPLWHKATNLTVMFFINESNDTTLTYFHNSYDLLLYDTSWVKACPVDALHPYASSDQRFAVLGVSNSVPIFLDPVVVAPTRNNFGHFLHECLPYFLGLASTPEVRGLPVICHRLSQWQRNILEYFDVDTSAIHVIDTGPEGYSRNIRFQEAIVPALLSYPHAVECIRGRLRRKGFPGNVRKRRFFLIRRPAQFSHQRLLNQDEVADMLSTMGFEIVVPEDFSFADQVKMFSETSIIIGIHGASLQSMAFAPEGATLVDILSDHWNQIGDNFNGSIRRAATCQGQMYYRVVCPAKRDVPVLYGMDYPFTCDVERLRRLVAWIDESL
ncbi:MAG: glycosyltransferase family 61 protein [Alphaproteobacteria bacterium]